MRVAEHIQMVPANWIIQPTDHVDAVCGHQVVPVVKVVLLGRVHRDHRAGLLPRIRLLLRSQFRTDYNASDQRNRNTRAQNALPHTHPPSEFCANSRQPSYSADRRIGLTSL
jgi:hypothetical protein